MPTVIDALVVSLSLDPKAFDEGQKKAVQSLRDFEGGAGRQMRQVETAFGSSFKTISGFIFGLEAPLSLLRRHLEAAATTSGQTSQALTKVGDAGTKTGTALHEGALAGSRGMAVLAGSALVALAAVTALASAIKGMKDTSRDIFNTQLQAETAGLSPERFHAIQLAGREHGPVSAEDTAAGINAMSLFLSDVRKGTVDQNVAQTLGRLRVPWNPKEGVDKLLIDIGASFARLTGEDAIRFGERLHLPDAFSRFLRKGGMGGPNQLEQWFQEAQKLAITPAQVKAADDFVMALNKLEDQFNSLSRMLFVDFEPSFEGFIKEFSDIIGLIAAISKGDWDEAFKRAQSIVKGELGSIGIHTDGDKEKKKEPSTAPVADDTGPTPPWEEIEPYLVKAEGGYAGAVGPKTNSGDAEGYLQITTGTWQDFAPKWMLEKWSTPNQAPKWAQDQVGKIIYESSEGGPERWETYPAALRAYRRDHPLKTAPTPAPDSDLSPLDELRQKMYGPDYNKGHPIAQPDYRPSSVLTPPPNYVPSMLGAIRSGQTSPTAAPTSNDNSIVVGDINVYTQTTDPQGHAQVVLDSLQRNLAAARAGTGLS